MLKSDWRSQCTEFLAQDSSNSSADKISVPDAKKFNLMVPRSACPNCGHQITAMENIPVISYLWLKGRCSSCGAKGQGADNAKAEQK